MGRREDWVHHRFPCANKLRKFCFMEVLNYVSETMEICSQLLCDTLCVFK